MFLGDEKVTRNGNPKGKRYSFKGFVEVHWGSFGVFWEGCGSKSIYPVSFGDEEDHPRKVSSLFERLTLGLQRGTVRNLTPCHIP